MQSNQIQILPNPVNDHKPMKYTKAVANHDVVLLEHSSLGKIKTIRNNGTEFLSYFRQHVNISWYTYREKATFSYFQPLWELTILET